MTTQSALQPVDLNITRSPARKRPRLDSDLSEGGNAKSRPQDRDDFLYDCAEVQGVGRLDYDSDYPPTDDDTIFEKNKPDHVNTACVSMSPDTREKQVAILESVLSKDTVHKLSMGEWDSFLIKKPDLGLHVCKTNHFDKLPDELILNIFRWLSKKELTKTGRVCKRFRRLMEDESLWTRMDLSNRNIPPGELGVFLGRQLIILRLARAKIAYPPIFPDTKAGHPDFMSKLIYLDLSMAEVSLPSLVMILQTTSRLRNISLENVPVNTDVLIALAQNTNLEVANLAMVSGIEPPGAERFLQRCNKLVALNIAWTYLKADCISVICDNLPSTLERLNFSGCKKLLTDEHVTVLTERCRNLRELDLSDCTQVSLRSLHKIATLDQLTLLSLSRCYTINSRDYGALRKCSSLQYLDIHGNCSNGQELAEIQEIVGHRVALNKFKFSSIARPTVGARRSSIWNLRAHD